MLEIKESDAWYASCSVFGQPPTGDTHMINRRRTLALAAALATALVVPATASASTSSLSASASAPVKLQRINRTPTLRNQWTSNYKKWSESRMRDAHWRIMMRSRNQMSHEKRAQLGRDLNEAVRVMRSRIDNLGRDNVISVEDQRQILVLRDAIRRDLSRYGNFDSFLII